MSVRVWPERAILFPGEILRLEAQAVDHRISGLSDPAGSWSSSDPRVATVDATGMVECREPGATTIRFTFRDAVAETHIEVRDASLRGLNIIAPASALEAGQSCELVAVAEFENGMVRDVSDQVVWQSSKPRVAEVEPDGTITAWAAGSSRVSASWHGVQTTLEIFDRTPFQRETVRPAWTVTTLPNELNAWLTSRTCFGTTVDRVQRFNPASQGPTFQ